MELYRYINETSIRKYDGEILKQWDGNKLVRVVANPTETELREFGYKELTETPMPEEREGYYWQCRYIDGENITVQWEEHEVVLEEEM